MKKKIAVLAGDGIGPEVMKEALCVLQKVACIFGHSFDLEHALVGGCAFDRYNCHLPEDTIAICQKSDAILFGSVGGPVELANDPKWLDCERNSILAMRKHFQFAVNFRPIKVYRQLSGLSPLKDNVVGMGVDLLVVRELVGDCYFGKHEISVSQAGRLATDESSYTEAQIRTAAHAAFKAAQKRRSHVTSVDKANVLITSRLWREVVSEVAASYPDVEHLDMLVDNCAM
ncbi:MAG: hypothetical protein K8F91_16785, partial [Candidatus Obscuribacterales bacterium]|nr:hypothetical protein [Candidatus Obscuribacterales bacterium]